MITKLLALKNKIGITARTELTEDENIIVNQFVRSVQKESKFVLDEIANRIYSLVKGKNNHRTNHPLALND